MDRPLALTVLGLVLFGLVVISSASVYESHKAYTALGVDCTELTANCNDFYFWRQIRNIIFAIPLGVVALVVPFPMIRRMAPTLFIFCVLALMSLFIPGISTSFGTSQSWVALPIVGSLQPSEFAKLGLIFYLARWMERRRDEIGTLEGGFIPFAIILMMLLGPLALQPDFGDILVLSMTATAIYFVAGAKPLHIFGGGALAAFLAWSFVMLFHLKYIVNRFMAFLDPSVDPEGIGFQIKQALIAVGRGGIFGKGLEGATQRFGYLPEVQSDAVYAAICEAFGFFGGMLVAGACFFIAYRGLRIAAADPDRFTKISAVGLSAVICGQAFIHIGVNISILPLTGITLPFISYGGTSMVVSFIVAGLLLNLSQYVNTRSVREWRDLRG